MTITMSRTRDAALRMSDVPRVVPFLSCRDAGDGEQGDGRTLDGFASVFGVETVIDSWEGRFREQFLGGSMRKSFREQTPIIQFDHGRHAMIGSIPVAAFERGYPVEETDAERAPNGGARVLARMHQAPLFEPVREAIATGTISGMSIRFGAVREKWYRPDGTQVKDAAEIEQEMFRTWLEDVPDDELLRRDIVEARVAEMGPVVWPAYTQTSVGVRSVLEAASIPVRVFLDGRELDRSRVRLERTPTDLIAAVGARSATGEETDAERQEHEASTPTMSRRQMADRDALRLRGIIPAGKG